MRKTSDRQTYVYLTGPDDAGKRLDEYLKTEHRYSSRLISRIKQQGAAYINDEAVKFIQPLEEGDKVILHFGDEEYDAAPAACDFDIISEDDDVLIVNKPPFLVVHPTKSHQQDTLANGIYAMWQARGEMGKARFVNRLDMNTSGVLVIAKNKYAHHIIQSQMKYGEVEKFYYALVKGRLKELNGIIDAPVARLEGSMIERAVSQNGKTCITQYEVVRQYDAYALLKIKLLTGRTHQIRVHMAHIGHPILGDSLYDDESVLIGRQALHAHSIRFDHPRDKAERLYIAPLPKDFKLLTPELS
jgi:23S rRNA pseudouridine1911/1915/1917 synthase